ncbi:unnamed protein product [Rangifer tarandus platyrhynchus]|uniref:Uncharacterized protein n=2 Tax=Rangifer tarandus platyrhynchus TaxID=3082113 RepID=A0ABN8ZLX2_RANTA|nr:unnamed protein product [Rangifer tarandus platyrhynchus]
MGPRVMGARLSPRECRARLGAAPWDLETRGKTRTGAVRPPNCGDERESPPGPPAPGLRAGSRAVPEVGRGRSGLLGGWAPAEFSILSTVCLARRLSFPQTRPPVSRSPRGGPGLASASRHARPWPCALSVPWPVFPRGPRRGRQGGCAEAALGPERQPQALHPREPAPAVGEVCSGSLKLGAKSPRFSWSPTAMIYQGLVSFFIEMLARVKGSVHSLPGAARPGARGYPSNLASLSSSSRAPSLPAWPPPASLFSASLHPGPHSPCETSKL